MTSKNIFQFSLILTSFLISLLAWRYTTNSIHITATLDMVWVAGLITFFIALVLLALAVFPTARVSAFLFLAFLAGFLLMSGARFEYIAGAAVSFLLFFYGAWWARGQMNNQLNAGFYGFACYGAPQTLTALALLFAVFGYFYPINFANVQLPPEMFKYAVPFAETAIQSFAPAYQPGMTVDDFISAGVKDALGNMPAPPSAKENAALNAAFAQEIKKQRDGLSGQIGVKLTGREKLPDIVTAVFNTYLSRYLTRYQNIAPAIIAVSIFLGIKSFGFIIDRLAVLLAVLMAKILLALGIIRKQKTTVDKEILTI